MIIEILIICIAVYIILTPIVDAKADEIRERARALAIENDEKEYGDYYGGSDDE